MHLLPSRVGFVLQLRVWIHFWRIQSEWRKWWQYKSKNGIFKSIPRSSWKSTPPCWTCFYLEISVTHSMEPKHYWEKFLFFTIVRKHKGVNLWINTICNFGSRFFLKWGQKKGNSIETLFLGFLNIESYNYKININIYLWLGKSAFLKNRTLFLLLFLIFFLVFNFSKCFRVLGPIGVSLLPSRVVSITLEKWFLTWGVRPTGDQFNFLGDQFQICYSLSVSFVILFFRKSNSVDKK